MSEALEDRVKRLSERSTNKTVEREAATRRQDQLAWREIKEKDPYLAELMLGLTKQFGPMQAVTVTTNRIILDKGQFQGPRDMTIKLNPPRWEKKWR